MDASGDSRAPRLGSRADTSPTATGEQTDISSLCLVIVSSLSLLGAGFMITSFLALPSQRTFRHRLLLGLAANDFAKALNNLISSSLALGHRHLAAPEQKVFCAVNGFANQVFVVQQDYWVLLIAVCTFILLTDNPHASAWIQSHQLAIMPLPWIMSFVWAWVGLRVSGGYGSIGSFCWFVDGYARLLVNFIPRWIIIVTIMILYARVYLVLKRSARAVARLQNSTLTSGSDCKPARHSFFSSHGQYARGNPRLRKTARMMMQYPLVYMAIWTLPTGVRIYHCATGRTPPRVLLTMDMCCVFLTGFVNAITYGVNDSVLKSWRASFSQRSYHPASAENRPNSVLLRPVAPDSLAGPAVTPNRLAADSDNRFGGSGLSSDAYSPMSMLGDGQAMRLSGPQPAHLDLSPTRTVCGITDIPPLPEGHDRSWT